MNFLTSVIGAVSHHAWSSVLTVTTAYQYEDTRAKRSSQRRVVSSMDTFWPSRHLGADLAPNDTIEIGRKGSSRERFTHKIPQARYRRRPVNSRSPSSAMRFCPARAETLSSFASSSAVTIGRAKARSSACGK